MSVGGDFDWLGLGRSCLKLHLGWLQMTTSDNNLKTAHKTVTKITQDYVLIISNILSIDTVT